MVARTSEHESRDERHRHPMGPSQQDDRVAVFHGNVADIDHRPTIPHSAICMITLPAPFLTCVSMAVKIPRDIDHISQEMDELIV
jgi:hypothetical protein